MSNVFAIIHVVHAICNVELVLTHQTTLLHWLFSFLDFFLRTYIYSKEKKNTTLGFTKAHPDKKGKRKRTHICKRGQTIAWVSNGMWGLGVYDSFFTFPRVP